jgi:hypothetical protein
MRQHDNALHQHDNALRQLDNAALYLAGRLSPYKIAKINTQTSKLVGCYFYYFAWLIA